MHVDMSATRRRAKRRISVNFLKFFGEQLFLAARRAHDKMAVLSGPIRRGLARLVRTTGAWDRGYVMICGRASALRFSSPVFTMVYCCAYRAGTDLSHVTRHTDDEAKA